MDKWALINQKTCKAAKVAAALDILPRNAFQGGKMDALAKVYKTVRDATVCNEKIGLADKIAVLECIKAELTADFLAKITVTGQ